LPRGLDGMSVVDLTDPGHGLVGLGAGKDRKDRKGREGCAGALYAAGAGDLHAVA